MKRHDKDKNGKIESLHPRHRRPPLRPHHHEGAQVQSLARALTILERLAEVDGLTLTDLALRVGLAPSTAHRLLMTLEQRRFVHFDEDGGRWSVGVQAFTVGGAFLRGRKVVVIGRPVMRRLMDEVGETVNMAVEDAGEVVYVAQVESHAPMRAFFRSGTRAPIHSSAVGKALLAAMPEDKVADILHRRGLPRFTPNTVDTPARLKAELAEVRRRGWAVDDEEHTIGMRCVAAAIYDEFGEPLAGVSVSGPTVRITDNRLAELGAMVVRAAAEITAESGGRVPDERLAAGS